MTVASSSLPLHKYFRNYLDVSVHKTFANEGRASGAGLVGQAKTEPRLVG